MKSKYPFILFPALAAGFSITSVHAAPLAAGDKIGIDFGTATTAANWNNFTELGSIAGGSVSKLAGTTADGVTIDVTANVSTFWPSLTNNWAGLSSNGGSAPAEFVDEVTADFVGSSVAGTEITVTLGGLDTTLNYHLYGVTMADAGTDRLDTLAVVGDVSYGSSSILRSDSVAGDFHTFSNVTPDGSGTITITLTDPSASNPILNGLLIEAVAPYVWDGSDDTWPSLHWNAGAGLVGGPTAAVDSATINAGTVTFAGHDTFGDNGTFTSPSINLNGGTLASNGWFNTIWNLNLNGGTLLANGGANGSFPSFQLAGKVTVGGSQASTIDATTAVNINNQINIGGAGNPTLTFNVADVTGNANPDLTINSTLQGGGSLTKTGGGTMSLTAANTYTGSTFVNAGTLVVDGGTIAGPGIIDIGANAATPANFTLTSGSVTAGGQFVIGAHGSTGTATINGGALQVNGVIYIGGYGEGTGTGTLTQTGGTVTVSVIDFGGGGPNNGIYNLNGGTLTTSALGKNGSGTTTINFNGGTLRTSATNPNFLQGHTAANVLSGGAIIDTNSFDITIAQPLLDGGGSGGLTKNGSGTLTLSDIYTYTGNTSVEAGTLILNQAYLADSADVKVTAGATLQLDFGGTDTIDQLLINGVPQATGTWGRTGHPTADHTTGLISGDGLLLVTTGSAGGYAGWASGFQPAFTNTAANLDFENDGLASGIEWVVGGNPTLNDAASVAPTFNNTTDPNNFLFTFRRRDTAATDPNTTIIVQYGSNLTAWTTAQDGVSGVSIDASTDLGGGFHQVTVAIPRALAPSGKLFARINVTVTP